jgi:hypothetical protein
MKSSCLAIIDALAIFRLGKKFLPRLKVSADAQSFCRCSKFLPMLKVSAVKKLPSDVVFPSNTVNRP